MIPMRLWSTVDEPARDAAVLPRHRVDRFGSSRHLRRSLVDVRLHVRASACSCFFVHVSPTAGIFPRPFCTIDEQRRPSASAAGCSRGSARSRPGPVIPWHVAQTPWNSARPRPVFAVAEIALVVGVVRDDHARGHRRVVEAAQLRALADVRALLVGLEPGVVRDARDRLDLAAELRDPPAVDDVGARRSSGRRRWPTGT